MSIAYQYNHQGYYLGQDDDYGFLPHNATHIKPSKKPGFIPRWTGNAWEQVEDHKGLEGYLDGQPYTVKDYGPLPAGFSDTPPDPLFETTVTAARAALRECRKAFEYGGFELDGQHWDSTEKDELRLNSVMRVFEAGIPSYDGWKIAEGVYITLTPELVQRAAMGLMQHYGRAFAVEAAKLAEIKALADSGQKAIEVAESDEDKRIAQIKAEAGVRAWIANELPQGW